MRTIWQLIKSLSHTSTLQPSTRWQVALENTKQAVLGWAAGRECCATQLTASLVLLANSSLCELAAVACTFSMHQQGHALVTL